MGKRLDTMLFPGGKAKAMTFSYDDGVIQDRRLVDVFRKYGVKGTFNLNSGTLGYQQVVTSPERGSVDISRVEPGEVRDLYADQEVGGHALNHSGLEMVGTPLAMYEIIEDRRRLEELTGKMVRMFAYPFGVFDDEVVEILRLAGYVGARTVVSTGKFGIPADFLRWNPTCHHNDPELMKLAEQFCTGKRFLMPQLFYVWGHAYEFDGNKDWHVIEELCEYVSRYREDIWFATNLEIIDYVTAYRRLLYSADGSRVSNPSAIDVHMRVSKDTYLIPAGGTVEIADPGL